MLFALPMIYLSDPYDWWLLLLLLVIGLVSIVAIDYLSAFPIAGFAAIATFFLAGSLLYTGIAFLTVALTSAVIGNLLQYSNRHRSNHHRDHHVN